MKCGKFRGSSHLKEERGNNCNKSLSPQYIFQHFCDTRSMPTKKQNVYKHSKAMFGFGEILM